MAKLNLVISITELSKGFKDLVMGHKSLNSQNAIHSISQLVVTLSSFHTSKILNVKTNAIAATSSANKILSTYRLNQKIPIDDILDLASNITAIITIIATHFNPSIRFLAHIAKAISIFGILNKYLSKKQLQKSLEFLQKFGTSVNQFKNNYLNKRLYNYKKE